MFGEKFDRALIEKTNAKGFHSPEVIQELWSGYGKIVRVGLEDSPFSSVVVKHVQWPASSQGHPRGWGTDRSHLRKIRSYEVEIEWYRHFARNCDDHCRVPGLIDHDSDGDEVLLILEDLNSSGFPKRRNSVDMPQIELCLDWLANFHATFLEKKQDGLWETGTYWHLDTRPDELEKLDDPELKKAAGEIDSRLRKARYQTFVHGDAKLANFCFSENSDQVAAVDFQYVGGGCGIKDVAYFIGSCLDEESCEKHESTLLDSYFRSLEKAVAKHHGSDFNPNSLLREWRDLFPVAWTDFHRFLKGWCPGHWKLNSYSEKMARKVLSELGYQN